MNRERVGDKVTNKNVQVPAGEAGGLHVFYELSMGKGGRFSFCMMRMFAAYDCDSLYAENMGNILVFCI